MYIFSIKSVLSVFCLLSIFEVSGLTVFNNQITKIRIEI